MLELLIYRVGKSSCVRSFAVFSEIVNWNVTSEILPTYLISHPICVVCT